MDKFFTRLGAGAIIFFAIGIGLYALSYLFINHGFLTTKGELTDDLAWNTAFYFHFIGGAVALLVGWVQFRRGFRNKRLGLHRFLGKVYVIAIVFVGGAGGLYLAFYANGGFANKLGFGSLAVAWLFTTIQAYLAIKRSDIDGHLKWMVRSYALTFAAPALRIWQPFFMIVLGVPFIEAYAAVAWFCWVPNLIIGEWILSRNLVKN